MRTWFWTFLVFIGAVLLALVLRQHGGNVLILAQPWRIELSLTLAVLLLLAAFVALHLVLRLGAWLSHSPGRFRNWRGLRARQRDHELLESGWIHVLEGRYDLAEKTLSRLLGHTASPSHKVLAALALARAAHRQGDFRRRDEALVLARDHAGDDARLKEASATVGAELYLDQKRPQDALVLLQPLQDASSRYLNATRLLLRAHEQLGNHDRVYELTRLLLRRGALDKAEALKLIEVSGSARLRTAGAEGFKALWGDLKPEERTLPDIALAAASIQEAEGNHEEVSRILEAAIGARLEPRLLSAYSQCPPDQVVRRLSKAEVWLKSNSDDSALLAALGNLCLIGELWGQGERYLLRSKKIRSDVRIHALLGNLYDRLGRQADAIKHWRLAAGVAGVLPVLPAQRALPAADMTGDPTLVDVETIADPEIPDHADGMAPVVPEPRSGGTAASAAIVSSASPEGELDEYFDSAPIPGVDLSQTSDQPRNGATRQ